MKKILFAVCALVVLVSLSACNCKMCSVGGGGAAVDKEGIKVIGTDELKTIVEKKSALIFDARSAKYDNGERIPGATALSAESLPDDVAKAITGKNAAVVVYCANTKCPASGQLAVYLKKLGYTNIMEYPEGIEGWKAAGNKVDKLD